MRVELTRRNQLLLLIVIEEAELVVPPELLRAVVVIVGGDPSEDVRTTSIDFRPLCLRLLGRFVQLLELWE